MRRQKTKPFEEPDIFLTNKPAPPNIKKFILANILPSKYWKSILFILSLLFTSPLLFLIFNLQSSKVFTIVVTTISSLYVLFCMLAGFLFIQLKSPYLQELKDKFGYTE
jgi:hypothetical protein